MADYITAEEFAERAGATPQAVYKRLQRDLAEYAIRNKRNRSDVKILNVTTSLKY